MQVTFYGAAREVTGSMHLLQNGSDHILLDCGLFQGRRRESEEKNRVLPVDPRLITSVVLSHAHIDHSGRIPLLTRHSFHGRVIATRASLDACGFLLRDSAKIQESDAQYLNYKTVRSFLSELKTSPRTHKVSQRKMKEIRSILKKNRYDLNSETIDALLSRHHLEKVRPLYSMEDAESALGFFESYPYHQPVVIGKDITLTFHEAGHILGSAFCLIKARSGGRTRTLFYTGDIGRFEKPIIRDPALRFDPEDRRIDLMIIESTYGNRLHEPVKDQKEKLRQVLNETHHRGGTVLIPSFAFGRTQEIIYVLHELYLEGSVPKVPVYIDSPLAIHLTRVFGEHPEVYDRETHATFLENGLNPFMFDQIHFISSVEESMALMREDKPHIVISSSGMCEAGRILHHLRHKIHQEKHTILIVGFMARNTLGRRILEKGEEWEAAGRSGEPPWVRFLNKEYPLRARVVKLDGFSAHGDKLEMTRFLKESGLDIQKVAIVHGEEDQSLAFADHLTREGFSCLVPRMGESIPV